MPRIVIIDYGMGNIRSVVKKIYQAGYEAIVTFDSKIIEKADKLILPGVGHFLTGMDRLKERNLIEILNKKACRDNIPILGICLGMQLFSNYSEEGEVMGLGWIDAETVKFSLNDIRHKVPQMGWNTLNIKRVSSLFTGITIDSQYYFVHSYHIKCKYETDILATTNYGYEFTSVVQKDNILGVQFHPEKSHESGQILLQNFLNL